MFSKNKSSITGSQSFKSQTSLKKKKNPAPPRPPQPSPSRLLTSQSFGTVDELNTHSQSGYTASNRPHLFTNLIDFSTPDPPRPKSHPVDLIASTQPDPPEFRYRVAASIFYIKSPLKNSTSGVPEANPFSPPRPSAQSLSTTTVKSGNLRQATSTSNTNTISSTTVTSSTKYISNPTIIKSQTPADAQSYQNQTQQTYTNASSTAQHTQYSNVPLQWDEPPKRTPVVTVIKPMPPPKKPGLGTKPFQPPQPAIIRPVYAVVPEPRNYYDVPPDLDDDDDDDDDDFDFESKPMPDIPPPPPPSDLEIQEWGDENGTIATHKAYTDTYGMEADRAYAIALYDYVPEADGDLALQIGDLVYLTKKIDDSWLFGVCGGIEGMFPTNYVNVVVPLPEEQEFQQVPELTSQVEPTYAYHYANVLYPFTAETESDLNLQTDDVVAILGRINDDWLYGEISGSKGQFPATFVGPVPLDLPIITL